MAILKRYLKCKGIALKKNEEPDAKKQQNSLIKPSPQLVQAYFNMKATIKHLKEGVMDAAELHRIATYESLVRMFDDTYPRFTFGAMAPAKHLADRAARRADAARRATAARRAEKTDGEVKAKKAGAELQQPAKPLQPVSKSVQFLTERLKITKTDGMLISSRGGRRGKAKLIPQVDASSLHINDKIWNSVRGLHKRLSEVTITTEKEVALYGEEHFAGPFTTLDATAVCRYGEFITDAVVYRFSQYRYRLLLLQSGRNLSVVTSPFSRDSSHN